ALAITVMVPVACFVLVDTGNGNVAAEQRRSSHADTGGLDRPPPSRPRLAASDAVRRTRSPKADTSERLIPRSRPEVEQEPTTTVLPQQHVQVATPAGPSPSLTGRERRADDHLLCVRAYVAGAACIDLP